MKVKNYGHLCSTKLLFSNFQKIEEIWDAICISVLSYCLYKQASPSGK